MHSSVPDTLTTAKLFLIGSDKVEIIGGSTTRLVLIISCAVTRLPSNCQTCVSHVTGLQCTEAPERQGLSPNNQQTADSIIVEIFKGYKMCHETSCFDFCVS